MIKCRKNLEVKVMSSAAGFYIGTESEEDGYPEPNCRISERYFKTEAQAQEALDNMSFIFRGFAPEIQFCNENHGCCVGNVVNNGITPAKPNWINIDETRAYIKEITKEKVVVFCGTHECAPEVIESFIYEVLGVDKIIEIPVPGDGEPSLYFVGDMYLDITEEILKTYGNWYIAGFECSEDANIPDPPQMIDADDVYGLEVHIDNVYNIAMLTIIGDTPYEDN